ncbi:MAG: hypothetical protein JW932_07655 [Deltaproteobacteria bacterium]|nr:hypothetical protein [Deltaproteobacteria bacterium]
MNENDASVENIYQVKYGPSIIRKYSFMSTSHLKTNDLRGNTDEDL